MNFETLLKIAWRNIWRSRRRSLLTLLVLGFATGVIVFSNALQLSSYDTAITASTSLYHGHLQIQKKGYLERQQIRNSFSIPSNLLGLIQEEPHVRAVSPRAEGFAIVASEGRSYGAQVVGVRPSVDLQLSTVAGVIRKGRYLSRADAREIIIGNLLARNLRIDVGDELTLLGNGRDGTLAADVLPVVGIFETGSAEMDRNMLQMPLLTFLEMYSMENEIHSLAIVLDDLQSIHKVIPSIEKLVASQSELVVYSWEELLPGLRQSIDLDLSSGWIFYIFLILVVFFSIAQTFLMSVLERTKEFGIMLALGTPPRSIALLILIECVLLTLLGLMLGIAFGSAVTIYFGYSGFGIPGSEEIMKLWNMPADIYPRLSIEALITSPSVVLGAAILASLYPALRVLWLKPVRAMRSV